MNSLDNLDDGLNLKMVIFPSLIFTQVSCSIFGTPFDEGKIVKPKNLFQITAMVGESLDFLYSQGVKRTNIEASDIIEHKRDLVLGLVWAMFLSFRKHQGNLIIINSQKPSEPDEEKEKVSPSEDSLPDDTKREDDKSLPPKEIPENSDDSIPSLLRSASVIDADSVLLSWCNSNRCSKFHAEKAQTFDPIWWKDGTIFYSILGNFLPEEVNVEEFSSASPEKRLSTAFSLARQYFEVPELLDAADVASESVSPKDLIMYTYTLRSKLYLRHTKNSNALPDESSQASQESVLSEEPSKKSSKETSGIKNETTSESNPESQGSQQNDQSNMFLLGIIILIIAAICAALITNKQAS